MTEKREQRFRNVVSHRQRGAVVVLEDIHDPHNVAAILRTCDAFGVQQIVCIYEKEVYANPRRVGRTSSGSANKWLDFTIYRTSGEAVEEIKKNKYRLFVTVLDESATPLYDTDMTIEPIALVFGNEHRGVSDIMRNAADEKVFIPMRGMVQSLNVSVTAAILLSEMTKQRRVSGRDFSLARGEQEALLGDFLGR